MWELHGAILDRFRELGRRRGFELAITFLPGTADTTHDKARRTWVKEYCEAHAVPFSDCTKPIHELPRGEVFIAKNPHYNPNGHRVVAERLRVLLKDQVFGDS